MILARELLESGERDAVLRYLRLCGTFWKMERGRLGYWARQVSEGKLPTFDADILY